MAGVAEEWTERFDRHGAALVLLARQTTSNRADAEDVVQEAFIRFWRSRGQVGDPTAYLFACVKRCALDWQRGRKRRSRREESVARREAETSFADHLEHDERRAAIEAALKTLPADQRETLVMKIWGGLSFPQIAEVLHLSANTAASRYRYALAKLREQLSAEAIP